MGEVELGLLAAGSFEDRSGAEDRDRWVSLGR